MTRRTFMFTRQRALVAASIIALAAALGACGQLESSAPEATVDTASLQAHGQRYLVATR